MRFLYNAKPLIIAFVAISAIAGLIYWGMQPNKTVERPSVPSPQYQAKDEVVIYFSKAAGSQIQTEPVVRPVPQASQKNLLDFALFKLLEGPTDEESVHGFFSEIPKGTRLLAVQDLQDQIRVNLSKQFVSGGGSNSIQQRLAELTQTILSVEPKRPVYLDVEGKELKVLGGEGLIVEEPINQGVQ
ncbi:MAG: GerMN domain-containing protein [Vampirovibrio sp.]|nr:GerMN domain-containing protein [Vampirovibrio sp.]